MKNLFRKSAQEYLEEGTRFSLRGEYRRAVESLTKAIELEPTLSTAWLHRGIARLESGEAQSALQDFNESIHLAPQEGLGYYNRAQAWLELGEEKHALQDLTEAIRLTPEDVEAYLLRGIVYGQQREYERAVADTEQAIRLGAGERGYNNKAILLEKQGDVDGALACWKEVLRLNPDHALALCRRGLLWERKGEYEEARKDLMRALRRKEQLPAKWKEAAEAALLRLKD